MKKSRMVVVTVGILVSSSIAHAAEGKGFGFNWFGKQQDEKVKEERREAKPETKVSPAPPPPNKALSERLANNNSMTSAQKAGLCVVMEAKFPSGTDFRDKQYEKDMLFFEQVANDPNMKVEEKSAAIQEHFAELQKEAEPAAIEKPVKKEAKEVKKEAKVEKVEPPKEVKTAKKKMNFAGK